MFNIKLILIYFFVFPHSILANYNVNFYNRIEKSILIIDKRKKDKSSEDYVSLLTEGNYITIYENEYIIANFSHVIDFEKTDISCEYIYFINRRFVQGYIFKIFINNNLIGEICATKAIALSERIYSKLELFFNESYNTIIKFSNDGWFSKQENNNQSFEFDAKWQIYKMKN